MGTKNFHPWRGHRWHTKCILDEWFKPRDGRTYKMVSEKDIEQAKNDLGDLCNRVYSMAYDQALSEVSAELVRMRKNSI